MGCTASKVAPEPSEYPEIKVVGNGTQPQRGEQRAYGLEQQQYNPTGASSTKKSSRNSKTSRPELAIFIGTGESGKSTVFKQMRLNYGQNFTNYERVQYAKLIWIDSIRAIRFLVDICDAERLNPMADPALRRAVDLWLGKDSNGSPAGRNESMAIIMSLDLNRVAMIESEPESGARDFLYAYTPKSKEELERLQGNFRTFKPESGSLSLLEQALGGYGGLQLDEYDLGSRAVAPPGIVIDRETVAAAAKYMWESCPGPIRSFITTNRIGLDANTGYFLDRIDEISPVGHLATDDEILRARLKTTGVAEATFQIKKSLLKVVDVGGQRIERSKWIQNFENVTTLLFVANVSDYDQFLEEDSEVNRLDEALEVFRQTVNSKWFRDKNVQLFLNKIDVLESKCLYSPFSEHHPDFVGDDNSPVQILKYVEDQFKKSFVGKGRNIYVHKTCATDRESMKFVVNAISDSILYENMKWAGMM